MSKSIHPIQEASIHRKALEEELQGRMSTELASLGRLQQEQGQLLEEQLAEMRQQQKLTRHLLTGDSHSTLASTPRNSPGALRPPTIYLERDLFEVIGMLVRLPTILARPSPPDFFFKA